MNKDKEYLEKLRHSAAHLLAAAVMDLWPDTKRTIGPAIDDGFYYDFEFSNPISADDLERIEKKMKEIVKNWKDFKRRELSKDEALKECKGNEYKTELINEFSQAGEIISFYDSGEFSDLCRGGHVENPSKELNHFKLLSLAGAYWRGDEKNTMLTRIYGTAFTTSEDLDEFLKQKELAKERDHRKIGKELEIYYIDEVVGKGLVMWLPNGTIMKNEVEKLACEMEEKAGYVRVSTPHIAKKELFLKSGHLPYYEKDMYPGMEMDDGTYYLKAMNCPHHHQIYLHKPKSYKDLPLRIAEYGMVYRNELSGTLAGLLRVRGLEMNDAHIYLRKDQIKDEFKKVLKLTTDYFELFNLKDFWFRLSKWDPKHTEKYINEPKNWEYSEQILREVLQEMDVNFIEADDEAAFYGPKVDVQFKSVIGREETMSTIQLDFLAKERFGLSYTDKDGQDNNEVFVIHRAPLSVHERFMAFLIEHFGGNFPAWLAPEQVRIIPISEDNLTYAEKLNSELNNARVRSSIDSNSERMQAKVREAQTMKVPYMLIVGKKEEADNTVSLRYRNGKEVRGVDFEKLLSQLKDNIASRDSEIELGF
ncbi:MAG: Threonine--tRNA ligase [candidate division WS6 bacterium OLB21]|uniref:Threonine--tRNA ligase n=1 Tax=candidate division WS6 bacterium OLB21 TaxID=1617427 RepID=A0A136KEU3_9BACT|nr:MAG: Threonine--tRNA ligase [candidate division WS6 bacterium OLB21]